MRTVFIVAVLLPCILAGAFDWGESRERMEGRQEERQESREESREERGDGNQEMMEAWRRFQQEQRARKWGERQEGERREDGERGEMAEKFRMWQEFQRMQEMRRMQEEKREREMQELRQKQMMVARLANITAQFKEQKTKMVKGVTSQFLEFCSCGQASAMVKKFFSESFGQMGQAMEWESGVEGWGMWSDMGDDDDYEPDQNMGGRNGTAGGNMTMPGGQGNMTMGGNGTMPGGQGQGNMTMPGGQGNMTMGGNMTMSGNSTSGDNRGDNYADMSERMQMERKAMMFFRMSAKQRSMELFSGLVKSLCERAGEYVQKVQKFEKFYMEYTRNMRMGW